MATKLKIVPNQSSALTGVMLVAPFFLSAIMVHSVLFALVSAAPLIWFAWVRRPSLVVLALISNTALMAWTLPREFLFWFVPYWFSCAIVFRSAVKSRITIPKSFLVSVAVIFVFWVIEILVFQKLTGVSFFSWLRSEFRIGIETAAKIDGSWIQGAVKEQGVEFVTQQIYREIPSAILISLVGSMWATLWVSSKWIKGFLSKSFWTNARFPFYMVWVTLVSAAAALLLPEGPFQWYGATIMKGSLAIHALQGVSIGAFILNRMKLNKLIQWVFMSILVLGATPVIVGVGFFDHWFDFRRRVAL